MNNIRLHVHSMLAAVVLLLAGALPASAADEGALFLEQLHEFRLNNFMALSTYYRYSATDDPTAEGVIKQHMGEATTNLQAVAESGANVLTPDQIKTLRSEFATFSELMAQNVSDVTEIGYPDLRLVGEMANQAVKMSNVAEELYTQARESSQTPIKPQVETARSASILMAQMLSRYAARSYSPVTQTFQGAAGLVPLDEQARQLDALISEFVNSAGQGPLSETVSEIESKWRFIRESYINYTEKNVVFVIERYSRSILQELDTAMSVLRSA
ncbi:hypothetical protein SAMN05216203_0256 [Marinobacter daqiaonensis]|uniref:Type IV pili methyl-accepting chemotaxis transducer N-term n=1 Tax=Marinobacter daqiaonensis TaxID=650891 RepID=A0A1I6GLU9_9GAMM|nr:hypothetical protein [Marinobacter daqiaonensis]SFR43202.1 hypothetical protein SAMN05216203_0256 [Marinobacter daqiaonensis]